MNRKLSMIIAVASVWSSLSLGARASDEIAFDGGKPPQAQPGECWCLVELPPQYKTVTERVMVAPETCRVEPIPAVYETRSERVCVRPESKVCREIPAEFRTESYRVCVKDETCRKEKIPAVYEDRTEQVMVCGEKRELP